MVPDDALVERFARDLDALAAPGRRIGVAVSGGADSLALLLLSAAARPGQVAAATVDHALRAESAGEARGVGSICASLGVPHLILRVQWDPEPRANLQARARDARYCELGRWAEAEGLAAVATAHHADDQAETILMRLARGAGVGGLAGIQRSRPLPEGALLVRPLLGWSRAELLAVVKDAGLTPVNDPSNIDPRFDRTRARDLLAAAAWLDPGRLSSAAANCAEAEAALDWVAEREFALRHQHNGDALLLDAGGLPPELKRRLLLRAFALLGAAAPDGPKLALATAILEESGTTTLAGLKLEGGTAWRLSPAPPRR